MDSKIHFGVLEGRIRDVTLDFDAETMRRAGYRVVDWIVDRIGSL